MVLEQPQVILFALSKSRADWMTLVGRHAVVWPNQVASVMVRSRWPPSSSRDVAPSSGGVC